MSQKHLFNKIFLVACPGNIKNFALDEHFDLIDKSHLFGKKGSNVQKWFGGIILPPSTRSRIRSFNLQKPAEETDFVAELEGKISLVSLSSIHFLVLDNSMAIGDLNIFFSKDNQGEVRLLALFKKNGLFYLHGYDDGVRQERVWRTNARIIVNEPL